MSEVAESSGTYSRKISMGLLTIVAMVVLAVANVYTNLAPSLADDQQSALLSGLVSVLLVLGIALAFVSVVVGRESLSALQILSTQARKLERGRFDASLGTNRDDEIGDTYRAMAAMRDSIDAERAPGNHEEVLAEYSRTTSAILDGERGVRLEENVDDPQLAELAMRVNELADEYEKASEPTP
jgi:HAMP domain-containing protein